jgi:hypothetical protein
MATDVLDLQLRERWADVLFEESQRVAANPHGASARAIFDGIAEVTGSLERRVGAILRELEETGMSPERLHSFGSHLAGAASALRRSLVALGSLMTEVEPSARQDVLDTLDTILRNAERLENAGTPQPPPAIDLERLRRAQEEIDRGEYYNVEEVLDALQGGPQALTFAQKQARPTTTPEQ